MASIIARQLLETPNSVLALPTGQTPTLTYRLLVEMVRSQSLSFANAHVFALDEYCGLNLDNRQTFRAYLERHCVILVDLDRADSISPTVRLENQLSKAARYEQVITDVGGIELAVLGIGCSGHIAYNEPGSPFDSRTRLSTLSISTIALIRNTFPPGAEPTQAMTIGIGTITSAARIALLATGASKARAIYDALLEPPTPTAPASALQSHASAARRCNTNLSHLERQRA